MTLDEAFGSRPQSGRVAGRRSTTDAGPAWLIEKQGTKKRRFWRKLHIGVDVDTGQIVAAEVMINDVDDGSRVGPLLD